MTKTGSPRQRRTGLITPAPTRAAPRRSALKSDFYCTIFGGSRQAEHLCGCYFYTQKKEDKTMAKTPKKKKNQLPSGSYRVQVYSHTDADGKKHYKSFTAPSKKLAQAAARMCSYGSATSPESCHPKQYATPTVSWNRLWPCSPQICVSGSPSRSGRNQSFTAQMMTTFGRCCITFREKSWKSPFSWRHLGRFGEVRSVP